MKRKQLSAPQSRLPLELKVQQSSDSRYVYTHGEFLPCFFFLFFTSHSEQVFCCPGSSAPLVLDGHDLKLLSVKVEGQLLKVSILKLKRVTDFCRLTSLF